MDKRSHMDSLLKDFKLFHHLIGSLAEATRLGKASEIDVFSKMVDLGDDLLEIQKWYLVQTLKGRTFLVRNTDLLSFGST